MKGIFHTAFCLDQFDGKAANISRCTSPHVLDDLTGGTCTPEEQPTKTLAFTLSRLWDLAGMSQPVAV